MFDGDEFEIQEFETEMAEQEEITVPTVPGWAFGMIDRYLCTRATLREEEELVIVLR